MTTEIPEEMLKRMERFDTVPGLSAAVKILVAEVRRLRSSVPGTTPSEALEKCMAVLRWHLGMYQRKDEPMMLSALEAGEAALGRRERLVPPSPGTTETPTRERLEAGYDLAIHSNPDAAAWARFFAETFPAGSTVPGESTMLGWFANAMMAIHDHLKTSAPPARGAAQTAIRWMGDDTQDCDVWELTRRRDRFTVLGSPTTLYFKMPNGTQIIVPRGWWVCDVAGDPFISSAAPPPDPTATQPSPGTTETGTRECEAWREQWVAGAAAVYRHEGNTPDRAESRARWLLDVTHGPALPVSRGEARGETIRPEVLAFARVMSAKIDGHNDDRGEHGWRAADPQRLMLWLRSYVATLDRALPERHGSIDPELVCSKAANVANLAMMIADVVHGFPAPSPGSETPRGAEDPWDGSFRDEIQCPHCGVLDEEHTDYPRTLQHDGDTAEIACWSCGKRMIVRLCASYTYATEPVASPSLPGDNHAEKEE